MIYFITTRHHFSRQDDITVLNDFILLYSFIKELDVVYFDKEFNSLNEILATPLLTAIGNETHQFVIDDISFPDLSYLNPFKEKLFVGHNIKIDLKVARLQNLDFRNVYDTMIVEQRLGLDSKRSNKLGDVYLRRCNKLMEDKSHGADFTKMNEKSLFTPKDIKYSANDIIVLPAIKEVQKSYIEKYNMSLLMQIEHEALPVIADGELEGMTLNDDLWRNQLNKNKKDLIIKERELDEILANLGLISYKDSRKLIEIEQTNLFGNPLDVRVREIPQSSRINYSSGLQVLKIFEKAGLPVPEERKKTKINGITKFEVSKSIGEKALQQYLIKYPKTKLKEFIEALIEQKGIEKNISSFGERFIVPVIRKKTGNKTDLGYKNQKTGRVHTIYRQCFTSTGRLSSGDADNGFFNSQQLPRDKNYRIPFGLSQAEIEDDWWITTCDLTGAEVVIMCALARDMNLYKWAIEEDDLHSPVATICWQAIHDYRIKKNRSLQVKDSTGKSYILTPNFKVNKKTNGGLRVDFKSVTFGIIYGAMANTIGRTINVPTDEAQIVIDVIKKLIPDTFKLVEGFARQALNDGYIVFNKRTNSRKWFAPLLKGNATASEIIAIEGEARNAPIQGTQADMVKEAMGYIYDKFKELGIPNCFLLQVHDELVWKHKGKENGYIIEEGMATVATKYLKGFTAMKADAQTLRTWTK